MSLATRIRSMKFEFQMAAGHEPDTLLLPRDKSLVKLFVEQFVDEEGADNTGSKPLVFHNLWSGEQDLTYCDLKVELYDGERLAMR